MKKFKIDYSFLLFFLLIFFSPQQTLLLKLIICLVWHEMGHLLFVYLCRYPIRSLKLSIFGFSMELEEVQETFWKDFWIYSGGILMNLLGYLFFQDEAFKKIHLALLLINSLPIYPLDGFNIFKTMLSNFFPYYFTLWIGATLSLLIAIGLLIAGCLLGVDLYLIFSLTYLIIESILLCKRIPKLYSLFLLKKKLYSYQYPIKKIPFHHQYQHFLYRYHEIQIQLGDKIIDQKTLLST